MSFRFYQLATLLYAGSALSFLHSNPQSVLTNPIETEDGFHFPSVHESVVMARRILRLTSIGTLVTTFPEAKSASQDDDLSLLERRPVDVENSPIGLMEYIADCESDGNPTLLGIDIATPFKNYAEGSNISLSVRWWPDRTTSYSHLGNGDDDEIPTPHTPAALPRFSLFGYLEPISRHDLARRMVPACFLKQHPDSILWQPGNDIHTSRYYRLVVEHVYWFGGFGDRSRIGWLPAEEFKNVGVDEIEACKLPGERNR